MAMQKEKKTEHKVVSVTEERAKRTRKRIANSTGSDSSMRSEMRNSEHSREQPAR